MFQGVVILVFLVGVFALIISGPGGVASLFVASGSAASAAVGGLIKTALPGVPAVYGSCAAALGVIELIGAHGWVAALVPDALVGVAAAVGLRKGVAALFGFPGAILEAWSNGAESGCLAVGQYLAVYAAIVFLSLISVGAWSGLRHTAKWPEFAEALALGAFGLVYTLRYLTYPGTYLHVGNRFALTLIAFTVSAAIGWTAAVAPDIVKAVVALTVVFLGGAWCVASLFGECAAFTWAQWLIPLAAALPGGLLARFKSGA